MFFFFTQEFSARALCFFSSFFCSQILEVSALAHLPYKLTRYTTFESMCLLRREFLLSAHL